MISSSLNEIHSHHVTNFSNSNIYNLISAVSKRWRNLIIIPSFQYSKHALESYCNMNKTAAESHRILVEVYGEHALAERTCQKWFVRFKSGDFSLEDKERPGNPKKFEDEELEALLDEDCCQT